ncbi:hypothetical protein MJH12_13795, partial [bacterium]|nr:hypothetical protein [bacterium]
MNIADFFTVSGGFSFEKYSQTLTLSDGNTVDVDMLTLGANNVAAFAGINGGSADAFGLSLSGVNLGISIATSKADTSLKWTTLKAQASNVDLVGIDDLTLSADTIEVAINMKASDGTVVDYKNDKLEVSTSASTSIEIDLDGSRGQLIQASGNLNINVFDFFTVSGGFAFVKSTETIILADGSEVEVSSLTLGGSNINAFAGIKGGTADQLGFALGGVSFGLALFSDLNDKDRKWMALKGNVGSAAFEGIDGLTVAASNMVVEINRFTGKDGASKTETTTSTATEVVTTSTEKTTTTVTKTNTILALSLKDTLGTIKLQKGTDSATFSLTNTDSDANLITKIKSAFESLDGIGTGNVTVCGSKASGFNIEFTNALEGKKIADVTVSTTALTATSTVAVQNEVSTGVSEIQALNILVSSNRPKGTFTLSFDGKTTKNIRFAGSDKTNNARHIKEALESLSNVGKGNVSVVAFPDSQFTIKNQNYKIIFKNKMASSDTAQITVNNKGLTGAIVSTSTTTAGSANSGETQRV